MKKSIMIIAGCLLAISVASAGMAFARGPEERQFKGDRCHHRRWNPDIILLTRYQHKNMLVQTLSELTGKSPEIIRQKLRDQRLRATLEEYKVDREAFHSAMRAKFGQLVKKSVENGSITAEQEKEILEKMENHSPRHSIMKKLIEKGVQDGTITPEEASRLMKKPFRGDGCAFSPCS
jgi:polyhydroxyalkanoate synthesis regulator phasin